MAFFERWVVRACIAVVVLCPTAYVGLYLIARAGTPDLSGTVRDPEVRAPVSVVRDGYGVPHIEAASEADAYYALGYCMAQDRLFQMEIMRRVAHGELAEVLGPPLVTVDTVLRTYRLRPTAEENAKANAARFPEVHAAAESFIHGVNRFVDTGATPLEYRLLGMPKRHFTVADAYAVGGLLPIMFSYGPRQDGMRSILQQQFPDIDMRLLFPGYTQGVPTTIMETVEEAAAMLRERSAQAARPAPEGQLATALGTHLGVWQDLNEYFGAHMGSNSWLLAPTRTASGNAVLANDPHIGFTNPSVFYEAHVRYGEVEHYGFYLPLIPFSMMGHNEDRGWGLTMFANDDVDMYVERIDPADPDRAMYKGAWTEVQVDREVIPVRFGDDVTVDLRSTPHGPIVTPFLERFQHYAGPPVSLWWAWQHVDYTDLAAFYGMSHAREYEAFAEAVSLITSPGINVSYADARGNIAWWAAGKIAVRPPHVDSKALLDGASGNDDPLGFLPFAENPHLKNPACGYIATANNKSTLRRLGPIADLEGYWQPWDRARRIEELIESKDRWPLDEVRAMQLDDYGVSAPAIERPLLAMLEPRAGEMSEVEREALQALGAWDGRHGAGQAGPLIYNVLCDAVLLHAVGDELGPDNFRIYGTLGDAWNFLKYAVDAPDSPFWDDVTTPDVESREDIVIAAWHDAAARLTAEYGPNAEAWHWGAAHTLTLKHPLGMFAGPFTLFNIGPFPISGAAQTINNLMYPHGTFHYNVIAGPATRRVIDFADPTRSYAILPTGNSGHWLSPNYDDQAPLFAAGQSRMVAYTPAQIDAGARHRMVLTPGA